MKRAKRAAQDDQNALLDAVRRHKGRPTAGQVLRDDDATVAAWTDVLRSALDEAYRDGRQAAGVDAGDASDALLREAAETTCFRCAIASPARSTTSTAAIPVGCRAHRARYREWKNQQLERRSAT